MKNVKYIMMLVSAATAGLCVATPEVLEAGNQGYVLLALCAFPLVQGVLSQLQNVGLRRSQSMANLVAFVVAAMKTREGEAFQNVMMAASVGALFALLLVLKPEPPPVVEDEDELGS